VIAFKRTADEQLWCFKISKSKWIK